MFARCFLKVFRYEHGVWCFTFHILFLAYNFTEIKMDPGKGRGRGYALLGNFQKEFAPKEAAPESAATSSAAYSVMSAASAAPPAASAAPPAASAAPPAASAAPPAAMPGGRGRIAAMLMSKVQTPGAASTFSPASDVSPSAPVIPRGVGRGIKIFQNLQAVQKQAGQGDVETLTQKMAESTVSETTATVASTAHPSSVAKNKYFREVKETPPVVKKGETGTPCEVTANFVYLNFEENNVFEYEVKYTPQQDYKNLCFKLLNEHKQYFPQKTFDGTTLYVPHKLPDEALDLVSTNPFDESKVQISIMFRRTRRLSEMIHIYNVLFKQIMKDLEMVRFGRQHFNEHAAIQIPQHKLEVWPGYVTAVDEYEGGLMLTLDSTHRVLRTQSVLTFIKEAVQSQGANWKRAITDQLVGSSVMTTYNKKLFRVDSIDDTMNPRSTFEKNEKGTVIKISYIDYYKKNYGIEIRDWDQPLLISRETKRMSGSEEPMDFIICLVPELCQLTGLTDDQRSNFRLMKDVATYTRITPNQRHAAFKKYIQSVLQNETARNRLAGWGLKIAQETINLTARTLPPEAIFFGNNVKISGKPNAEWNNEVTRHPVMQAVDILRWVILFTDRDKNVTKDFLDTLKRCCGPMGISVSAPEMIRLPNDRTDTYVNALKKSITDRLQLIVVICPTARDDRYAMVKRICCADNAVPSQVINARTISNAQKIRAITQKILLQINCKLGGTLWNISIPFKTAMIVGIDSYHDAGRKKKSVCSFIASYNQTMTQWYSKAVYQDKGQEIVDCLKTCLHLALKHYLRTNGKLPDRIIMYRDGVGDGQLKLVRDYEIPQMLISLKVVDENYEPTLTYIVVQKRINTRIFLKAGRDFENPNPGTVVDHGITRRDWYDFLIVSQKVNQGTVTPTHYIVLYDSSGMTPDQCQRITYKMCHLYYNWPGTVRVPAPCQYAHKLAYLVGQSIHHEPAVELADKLFFL